MLFKITFLNIKLFWIKQLVFAAMQNLRLYRVIMFVLRYSLLGDLRVRAETTTKKVESFPVCKEYRLVCLLGHEMANWSIHTLDNWLNHRVLLSNYGVLQNTWSLFDKLNFELIFHNIFLYIHNHLYTHSVINVVHWKPLMNHTCTNDMNFKLLYM